jgi:hypothetical protein
MTNVTLASEQGHGLNLYFVTLHTVWGVLGSCKLQTRLDEIILMVSRCREDIVKSQLRGKEG